MAAAKIILFAATSLTLAAQQPQLKAPDIRSTTRLVTVDVEATTRHGEPVHGLTCADFQLQEAKVAQVLQHCEEHRFAASETKAPHEAALLPNVFSNDSTAPVPATWDLIVIDLLNAGPEWRSQVKQEAYQALGKVLPGHRVAVFLLGDHLMLLSGFTDNLRALETSRSINETGVFSREGTDNLTRVAGMSDLAAGDQGQAHRDEINAQAAALTGFARAHDMRARVEATLEALRQINAYAEGLPGRKKLVWLTASFPIMFQPNDDSGTGPGSATGLSAYSDLQTYGDKVEDVSRALAKNRISIFPVDVRGVVSHPLATASESSFGISDAGQRKRFENAMVAANDAEVREHTTMTTMAAETGGHAFYGSNDIGGMMQKALDFGTDYYTLSYRPTHATDDGRFRAFHIASPREGLRLIYRRGYLAPSPAGEAQAKQVADAANQPSSRLGDAEGVYRPRIGPAMSRGLPNLTSILFAAKVSRTEPQSTVRGPRQGSPPRQYGFEYTIRRDDLVWTANGDARTAELTMLMTVYDSKGGMVYRSEDPVRLQLGTAQYEHAQAGGIHVHKNVSLVDVHEAYFRLGVLDAGSDRLGTMEIATEQLR